ncbi:molecular chaperone [Bacillus sp. 1P06AnD]|uniref:TorD/DmsD family molecular chaperone n=1 Tax=Bacillus sp. 1P06AnD TaxID=3132208 RepID=UPI00399EFF4A
MGKMIKEYGETMTEEYVAKHLPLYLFLQNFYGGQLNELNNAQWKELLTHIDKDTVSFEGSIVRQGVDIMLSFSEEDAKELKFDFNSLFIGPDRLKASPFESSYRNETGAILQTSTLAVRKFYEAAGLVVELKNQEPDDHIIFELEFVCYLLEKSVDDEQSAFLYKEFHRRHLSQWIGKHCEKIRENSSNKLLVGISYILQGLMEDEKKRNAKKEGIINE